ncbi:Transcription factor 15 [Blomia tropicalis]|nr:Transcription factor 15 [Blomia tropicalis]
MLSFGIIFFMVYNARNILIQDLSTQQSIWLQSGILHWYSKSSDEIRHLSNNRKTVSKQPKLDRIESHHKQRHRAIANARERDRTESVNYAFTQLRSLLPTDPPNRKLSKIEVLRLATSYIEHLDNVRTAIRKGESYQNICARVSCVKVSKVFCTFCVTTSKLTTVHDSNQQKQSAPNSTVSSYVQPSWSCITSNLDLPLQCFNDNTTDKLTSQVEQLDNNQDIVYTELCSMTVDTSKNLSYGEAYTDEIVNVNDSNTYLLQTNYTEKWNYNLP